jgi:activator of 2-hydroxyglutaryl-CoA dehydratase
VDVSELGPLSLEAKEAPAITSQCSIFTELEIMHLLMEGRSTAEVAAGINQAMARRVKMLVGRVGVANAVGMTGGVSKNTGVVHCLEQMLQTEFVSFPQDPQIIGALGAALFAAEKLERRS